MNLGIIQLRTSKKIKGNIISFIHATQEYTQPRSKRIPGVTNKFNAVKKLSVLLRNPQMKKSGLIKFYEEVNVS